MHIDIASLSTKDLLAVTKSVKGAKQVLNDKTGTLDLVYSKLKSCTNTLEAIAKAHGTSVLEAHKPYKKRAKKRAAK